MGRREKADGELAELGGGGGETTADSEQLGGRECCQGPREIQCYLGRCIMPRGIGRQIRQGGLGSHSFRRGDDGALGNVD